MKEELTFLFSEWKKNVFTVISFALSIYVYSDRNTIIKEKDNQIISKQKQIDDLSKKLEKYEDAIMEQQNAIIRYNRESEIYKLSTIK